MINTHLTLPLGTLLTLVVAIGGCNRPPRTDYAKLALVDVEGVATLDGEPLSGATVVFRDESGSFSSAVTDAGGGYRLMFDSAQPGVRPGSKTVEITRNAVGEEMDDRGTAKGEGARRQAEVIPVKYNRKSTLRVDVTETSRRHDFALESR